jgi:hypothetical protein
MNRQNIDFSAFDFLRSRREVCAKILAYLGMGVALTSSALAQSSGQEVLWHFDRMDRIGGNPAHVEGQPRIIETPAGKAIQFDGVHDGLFIDKHPLAGFEQFTFEALVRPDGGDPAQRWFHLAETDLATGLDATVDPANPVSDKNSRFTFELRVVDGERVYFESFTHGPGYQSGLLDKTKTHPLGQWYVVTQTYDGKIYRSYVNGELEKEAPIAFVRQGLGHSSVGVRINHVSYFKGAVMRARFLPRALGPSEFMKVPASLMTSGRAPR